MGRHGSTNFMMGQDGSQNFAMGHGSKVWWVWVWQSMGQVGHGSTFLTHFQLCCGYTVIQSRLTIYPLCIRGEAKKKTMTLTQKNDKPVWWLLRRNQKFDNVTSISDLLSYFVSSFMKIHFFLIKIWTFENVTLKQTVPVIVPLKMIFSLGLAKTVQMWYKDVGWFTTFTTVQISYAESFVAQSQTFLEICSVVFFASTFPFFKKILLANAKKRQKSTFWDRNLGCNKSL